jgi:hypothetical protein
LTGVDPPLDGAVVLLVAKMPGFRTRTFGWVFASAISQHWRLCRFRLPRSVMGSLIVRDFIAPVSGISSLSVLIAKSTLEFLRTFQE